MDNFENKLNEYLKQGYNYEQATKLAKGEKIENKTTTKTNNINVSNNKQGFWEDAHGGINWQKVLYAIFGSFKIIIVTIICIFLLIGFFNIMNKIDNTFKNAFNGVEIVNGDFVKDGEIIE